jgi:cation diffusion facilitator family transporter
MENITKAQSAGKTIRRVTYLGILSNVVLAIIKAAVGFSGGSLSLLADAVHSISDSLTDGAVLLGYYLGSKKADTDHPYGHGRAETFAALFVGVFLFFAGVGMIYYPAVKISEHVKFVPGNSVAAAAVLSIIVKEFLYRVTRTAARKTNSSMVYANAWHHRTDALSSVAVIIGFIASKFGFIYADQLAAIVVGVMILYVAAGIIFKSFRELTEAAVDEETKGKIKKIVDSHPSVRGWHKLRTRTLGREIFLDLHILVDPELNIRQAHQISEKLENDLHKQMSQPLNITVHIEPDIPELRV